MEKTNNIEHFAAAGGFNLNRIVYFAAVVETGSFTKAAERLGITKAVVSQQITRLEADFRTALLIRTTRHVRTTEVGQAFYTHCTSILKEAEQAFGELSASASEPSGVLRLTVPFDYGLRVIVPALTPFTTRYPNCQVDVHFSDEIQALNASQFDLAIRVGWLKEQHLQVRKLGTFSQKLVAAPQFVARFPAIHTPESVASLPFIANTALREPTRFIISKKTAQQPMIATNTALFLNATLAVREATMAGTGISVLPDYVINEDLQANRLIELLADWSLPDGDIYAVYPTTSYRPAHVRAFVDLLMERLGR